jgi:hypothetical protein
VIKFYGLCRYIHGGSLSEACVPMSGAATETELAQSIMAAVVHAREHGVAEDRIVDTLADAIKVLLERAGTIGGRQFGSLPLRRKITASAA